MRRRTFDLLASVTGGLLALLLLLASWLAFWGAGFAEDNVNDRLRPQKIAFPAAASLTPEERRDAQVVKYAGQPVDNGDKARVYADLIAIHLEGVNGGKTYAETSAEARALPPTADPKAKAELDGKVQTLFRGETLRSILYNAYGWWKVAQVIRIAAWVALISGLLLGVLTVLGLWHARRTTPAAQL